MKTASLRTMGGRPRSTTHAVAAALLATAVAVGCGDDISGPQVIEEVDFDPSLGIDLAAMTRTSSGLYYEDIEPGAGDPAADGQNVRVAYTGWLANGSEFDSGEFGFPLGAGQVVAGFDEGVRGMRAGGIRRIIIPPALGYGSQGRGSVPPNSIMVFRIELLSIS